MIHFLQQENHIGESLFKLGVYIKFYMLVLILYLYIFNVYVPYSGRIYLFSNVSTYSCVNCFQY